MLNRTAINSNYSGVSVMDVPGICPNISANPPRVSLSSFNLGMKGPSKKKSVLIPWAIGGIKTPKSCKTQSRSVLTHCGIIDS
jgi:hypothetical protein